MDKITIQADVSGEKQQPYPYHIKENGRVGRQDFWQGEPYKLLGFSKHLEEQKADVDLTFEDFWEEPEKAVGMYFIMENEDGDIYSKTFKVGDIIKQ